MTDFLVRVVAIPGFKRTKEGWTFKTWATIGIVGAVVAVGTALIVKQLHKS